MKIQLSDHFTYQRLLHFCLPSIVMMIFTSIYGVVDGLFVSNFVGKIPFAAINLVMPFIMILGGFGFMIGTGGSALIAKTLGEGRHELANRYFSMLIIMTVILGLILTTIGIVFARRVSILLGATDVMLDDCVIYLRTVLLFISPFMLQNVFQSFLVTAREASCRSDRYDHSGTYQYEPGCLIYRCFPLGCRRCCPGNRDQPVYRRFFCL